MRRNLDLPDLTCHKGLIVTLGLTGTLLLSPVAALATEAQPGQDAQAAVQEALASVTGTNENPSSTVESAAGTDAQDAAAEDTQDVSSAEVPAPTTVSPTAGSTEAATAITPSDPTAVDAPTNDLPATDVTTAPAKAAPASVAAQPKATAPAATTQPDQLAGATITIQNGVGGRGVVDVSDGSTKSGANVQLYESNATNAQRWEFRPNGDGTYTIYRKGATNMVLDVQGGGTPHDGQNVQLYQSNGTKAQRWRVVWLDEEGGIASLFSCLDSQNTWALDLYNQNTQNGTNLAIWRTNGTAAQRWRLRACGPSAQAQELVSTSETTIATGDYVITSKQDGKALDVANASVSAGAKVQTYASNGTLAQVFHLERTDGGYRILNMNSGLALSTRGDDPVPGGSLWQAQGSSATSLWHVVSSGSGYMLVNDATGLALSASSGLRTAEASLSDPSQLWSFSAWKNVLADGVYRVSSRLGNSQALDVSGGSQSSGANVQDYAWNGTMAQRWYVSRKGDGTYTVRNLGSHQLLTAAGSVSGANVCQSDADDGSTRWTIQMRPGMGWVLANPSSGLVLDVNGGHSASGTNVQLWAYNGSQAQGWDLSHTEAMVDGWYQFSAGTNGGLSLDVSGGSHANGANVQVWTANGTDAQKWWVRSVGGGWFSITNGSSNKVLDVSGGSAAAGANVQQYAWNSSNAQKWRFTVDDTGYRLINALGTVLDIQGASTASGANVQTYTANGTAAQTWVCRTATAPRVLGSLRAFTNNMVSIANDNSHGYDQMYRWGERGDYDCSSLVVTCLRRAGFQTYSAYSTRDLRANLVAAGWEWIPASQVSSTTVQPGDILLAEGNHTAALVTYSDISEAYINERGTIVGGRPGDQTGREIRVTSYSGSALSTGRWGRWWDGILRANGSTEMA